MNAGEASANGMDTSLSTSQQPTDDQPGQEKTTPPVAVASETDEKDYGASDQDWGIVIPLPVPSMEEGGSF